MSDCDSENTGSTPVIRPCLSRIFLVSTRVLGTLGKVEKRARIAFRFVCLESGLFLAFFYQETRKREK